MIVPMKRMFLLCVADEADGALVRLRDLGAAHLEFSDGGGAESDRAKERLEIAERAVRIVMKARKETGSGSGAERSARLGAEEVLELDARRDSLKSAAESVRGLIRRYEPFGDFDPGLAKRLSDSGVRLVLRDDGSFGLLYGDEKDAERPGVRELPLPEERLSAMRDRLARAEAGIAEASARLASVDETAISSGLPGLRDAVAFAAAKDEMSVNLFRDDAVPQASAPQVAAIGGWIPADRASAVESAARKFGWGIALRDPDPGETPPTLIRPPRFFRPVKALFDGLGIAPAYTESDVSVPFMCYFSVFFAMLVGDGGYGAIIFALTLAGWRKYRRMRLKEPSPLVKSWLTLLTVFSVATIAWGAVSNTWFGAGLPFAAEWPTVKWLGDPTYNNMMFLCFSIGTSHLVLARVWNGVCLANSLDCLPEFGWAGILVFMYFVVNAVVGISPVVPAWSYWLFGASAALVVSRTRGVSLGMLPLNVMGAMGDIISYVRLFAVGYASLQVAKNFNEMALGLDLPAWAKVVPMIAILLLGHGINFALAGLSILVHAVRLNTLEFSNHKGLTWSGYPFRPFRKEEFCNSRSN